MIGNLVNKHQTVSHTACVVCTAWACDCSAFAVPYERVGCWFINKNGNSAYEIRFFSIKSKLHFINNLGSMQLGKISGD